MRDPRDPSDRHRKEEEVSVDIHHYIPSVSPVQEVTDRFLKSNNQVCLTITEGTKIYVPECSCMIVEQAWLFDMRNQSPTSWTAGALRMWREMLTVTSSSFLCLSLRSRRSCISSFRRRRLPPLCHLHHRHRTCLGHLRPYSELWPAFSSLRNFAFFSLSLFASCILFLAANILPWSPIGPPGTFLVDVEANSSSSLAADSSQFLLSSHWRLAPLCPIAGPVFS